MLAKMHSICLGTLPFARHMATAAATTAGDSAARKVGFIGLGRMGYQMLTHLVKSGHRTVVFDSNEHAVERALALGEDRVEAADSPAELAAHEGVDVLFTMLPHGSVVSDVYLGKKGVLAAKGGPMPGLLVDCSTLDPATARRIAAAADRVRLHRSRRALPGLEDEDTPVCVDAPVSGGVLGAEKGSLSFMVGCDDSVLPVVSPFLKIMGNSITHCGGHGNGSAAKLCNTLAMAASMAATSEAIALAQRLGVDPKVMSAVLNSSAGASWSSAVYNPVPGVCPDAPPSKGYKAGFATDSVLEQLDLVVRSAEASSSPVPLARHLKGEVYKRIHDEGLGDKDFSSVYRYYYGSGTVCEEWESGERLFNTQIP